MENERTPAIVMKGISKEYRLGVIGGRTLQEELQTRWALRRGKEDPNSKIMPDGRTAQTANKPFLALDGIDLTVYKGERLGIIGANGAGKSTLLKLLSRVTAPTTGEIDLYGRVASMLEVGTGFHSEMTGRENIYMNGAILGMTRSEIDARIEDIIDFSEVREFIDTPVKRYSSGMFVKLAFAVAAHLNSEIIIMDEVLAVGDMAFQQKCLERMRKAADEEGRTVLYVSHNMSTIRNLCERCIVLDHGHIIYDGDVEQAISAYMDNSLGENEVDIDLTTASHSGAGAAAASGAAASLERVVLRDKVTAVYAHGEDLRMRFTISSGAKLEDVCLRVTLRTDGDVGIGTAWSEPFAIEEGNSEADYTLSLEQLAKGTFYASVGLYTKDEIGRYRSLDHITRAFRFELTGLPIWNTGAHGYVELSIRSDD